MGSIAEITVDDGGSGYTAPTVDIADAYGKGFGATAHAVLGTGGVIESIVIDTPGADYTAPVVSITDADGADAAATAVLDVGSGVQAIGNPLIARQFPTSTNANVFVVYATPLPAGQLTAFLTFNQPSSGPNTFNAYVLRPAGANQYTVVFDSGTLSVPSIQAPGAVARFDVAPFNVLAGDARTLRSTRPALHPQ
jgi:hypothetical protein